MQIITRDILDELREEIIGVEKEVVELKNGYGVNVVQLPVEGAIALSSLSQDETENAMFVWISACCVDDDCNPVFTKDDVKKLPTTLFNTLSEAVMRLNGLLNTDVVEDAEKNSEEVES